MKINFLIIVPFALLCQLHAQEIQASQVPSVILNKFNYDYPKAIDVDWEMKQNLYEVEFEIPQLISNKEHKIHYTKQAKEVYHKEDIEKKNLPKTILQNIHYKYPNSKIGDVEKINDRNQIRYKVEINNLLDEDWEIIWDENGKIRSKRQD